jgi:hypothetical protein
MPELACNRKPFAGINESILVRTAVVAQEGLREQATAAVRRALGHVGLSKRLGKHRTTYIKRAAGDPAPKSVYEAQGRLRTVSLANAVR